MLLRLYSPLRTTVGSQRPGGRYNRWWLLGCILLGLGFVGGAANRAMGQLTPTALATSELVFPSLSFRFPISLVQAQRDDTVWFIAEREGKIYQLVHKNVTDEKELVLDISAQLGSVGNSTSQQWGITSMALHPLFPDTPALFVAYNGILGDQGRVLSIVSRFTSEDGGKTFAVGSEEILFSLEQNDRFHHLGTVTFGIDGYLYVGFGDGTTPFSNAQNVDNLFGALLRVDVDASSPYAIPPDNPLVGTGHREEIFAWGLRNPWRFSIDQETGIVWAGDVGNNEREEVNQVLKGGNYGWAIMEGNQCVNNEHCDTTGLTPPVFDYPHNSDGAGAVIGGYVYRGRAIPALYGVYVFADYFPSQVWTLTIDGAGQAQQGVLMPSLSAITCFAQDNQGELYYFNGGFGADNAKIYKIVAPKSP